MVSRQNSQVALDGDFSIGLCWWLLKPFGVEDTFASHAGDIPPFHTVLVTIPGRRIGVFLAANSSRDGSALIPLAVELVRAVYAEQTGRPVSDPPPAAKVRLDQAVIDGMAGTYASPMGRIEVRPKRGRILARVLSYPLELVPRADGTFTAELSLLGLVSVPVSSLGALRITPFESSGHAYLRITTTGILAGVAERLPPMDVPDTWKARVGKYAIVPRGTNSSYRWPQDVALEYDERSDLLLLSYSYPGLHAPYPLLPRGDNEAVIAGTGTGLGDTITAREEGGDVLLEWAGLLLKTR
jgi:hypothetical protein